MRVQFGFRVFLPFLLLILAAFAACGQQAAETTALPPLATEAPVEPARPLTQVERAAIDDFVSSQQSIDQEWAMLRQDFDGWRIDLAECHPSAAREALREFAASFTDITASARNLPRTASTKELADTLIDAANAEETAFRQLRDRWQPSNASLLETVELQRAEASRAQNAVVDMSLELQEEYEEGPTADEVEEMEEFSDTFDGIADAWDDFHDDYTAFEKREHRMKAADQAAGYETLLEQLRALIASIKELTPTEITEDLIEDLLDAAESELAALEYLAEYPPDLAAAGVTPTTTAPVSATAPSPPSVPLGQGEGGEEPDGEQGRQPQAVPTGQATAPATGQGESSEPELTPKQEFAAAFEEGEAVLAEVEAAIEEIADDKSAEYLEDLKDFDVVYGRFVAEWDRFYGTFTAWRANDGGCDRVQVETDLAGFSLRAEDLASQMRQLPQTGFLVPVYTLTVEAAEAEAEAMRTLANSWTPFAVDSFRAVDDERLNASRLRRQAGIALQELQTR